MFEYGSEMLGNLFFCYHSQIGFIIRPLFFVPCMSLFVRLIIVVQNEIELFEQQKNGQKAKMKKKKTKNR